MRIGAILIFIFSLAASPVCAEFNDVITGSRPAGMGNAFVALADDVNALYWNPAGMTLQKHMEVGFMHAEEETPTSGPSIATDFLGWSSGNSEYGAVGFAFLREGLSDIQQERTLAMSYGYALTPFTRLGANFKSMATLVNPQGNFHPDPALANDSTMGVDLSFLHIITPDFRIGGLGRNFLAKIGHVDREDVTKTYRLGAAYRLHTDLIDKDYIWFTFDLYTKEDINDTSGMSVKNAIGAEWQLTPWIAVRAGADNGRLAGGAGLALMGLSVDYSIASKVDGIGTSQRVSITYRFGSEVTKERHEVTVRHRAVPDAREPRLENPPARKKQPEGD